MKTGIVFHDPWWLLVLLAVPAAVWLRHWRGFTVWLVPFAAAWHRESAKDSKPWPVWAAVGGLVLLTFALARPQRKEELREVRQAGYDIMLVVDLSPSMHAEDYKKGTTPINRLQALRPLLNAFIERRPNDRIGMVVFSGRAYTLAPLTFDRAWLARQIDRLKIGMLEDGTAIGDALAVALLRIEQGAKSRGGQRDGAFVVLMTDGASNAGLLTPMESTELAKERGVPVYTMAIGTTGLVNMPYFSPTGEKTYQRELSDTDELTLLWIATRTGGKFFRAVKQGTIEGAFQGIAQAQKIEFRSSRMIITAELFPWFAVPGAVLMVTAAGLAWWPRRSGVRGLEMA
ncbi:MAG: VWA domain-containing protein [Verrucomicrobiota bacterium]